MAASALEHQPLTTVRLYGALRRFGREFRLAVASPAEAIRALCVQIPGFERFLANSKQQGLTYAVFNGRRNIGEEELQFGARDEIRIAPVIIGSKSGGIFQTVLGVALIAASAFMPAAAPAALTGALASTGASMAIGGVIQMLSPQARGIGAREDPDNKPSYAFGGPVNTTAQGNPVGVLYGRRRIGGAIISAGIHAEDQM